MCPSPNITVMKSRTMRWEPHVASMGDRRNVNEKVKERDCLIELVVNGMILQWTLKK
jgi:hypothetical protein